MTLWVHRVNYSATALHYIQDIILNLLIVASGIALLRLAVFLFG